MAKLNPGDNVKYSAKFLKSTGQMSDRGRRGVITDDPTGMPAGRGFVSVMWNDEKKPQPIQEVALMKTSASFKAAVPGNLSDNTKPSTPATQKHAIELLKQGGILPPTEQAADYPVLTAKLKRDIIATLLREKQPKLAMWASTLPVRAAVSTSFKKGEIWKHNKVNGLWFAPLGILKNGGVAGLEVKNYGRGALKPKSATVPSNIFNWFDIDEPEEWIREAFESHPKFARASFKAAVPGNLSDNTQPSTPQTQKHAVELLKEGGVLPETEKAADYPVLTAELKHQIIATLLKRKQPALATWASRNLVAAG